MKSTKATIKSFKNLISKTRANKGLVPNQNFGETLIPIGSDNLFIQLPNLSNTYTYNIINTDEMTGNITLRTTGGASLKGLILNTMNGNISIDPIDRGATSFEMGADMNDGCFVQTVSNGRNWFIWSVSTNGTYSFSRQGSESESGNGSSESSLPANVIVDSITATTTFPNLQARHDLLISGRAEPNSTITISEDGEAIQSFTIQVASDGTWSTDAITNLINGEYSFNFIGTVGESVEGRIWTVDAGALTFTTPSSFTVERGETFDFSTGAFAQDPYGNPINTFTIDDSAYNANLTHGATFDIVYSFTYNSQTYTRTVSGTVEDTAGPEAPVSNPSTINGNTFAIDGTTEPGSTVAIYFDGVLQGEVTADPVTGAWEFEKELTAPQTFEVTTESTDTQGNVGDESNPVTIEFNPTYPEVTLELVNAAHNVWTNVANPIQISGTTDVGATVTVYNGSQLATLASGPTYDGSGGWTAAMNVADESITTLTAIASLNGYSSNGSSSPRTARVDRVPPDITLTGAAQTVYLGDIGETNDEGFSVNDNVSGLGINSGAGSQSSDWSTVVVDSEGTYTVTYNATDAAGNSATSETRDVTVTTEVIVPTNLVAVDNGDGTVTLTGDVLGTYADNLQVKINVIDSDGLEAVYQQSSSDVSFDVTSGSFTAIMILDADTYTFEAQTINSIGEASSFDDCTPSNSVEVVAPPAPVGEFYEDRLNSATIGDYTNPTNVLTQATYDDATGVLFVNSYSTPEAILNVNGGTTAFATNNDPANDGDTTKKVSISMWFKTSAGFAVGRTYMHMAKVQNADSPNSTLFEIIFDGNNFMVTSPYTQAQISAANRFTNENGFTISSMLDNQWHHFMYYYDGASNGSQKIFIDGVLAASKTHNADRGVISDYMHSGFSKFWFNKTGENYIGGDFDSLTFYQGFEMTEQIAGWIASDATRQRIYSDDVELPPVANFLEDSSSLVLDQSFVSNGWLEYTASGTLRHDYTSNTGNGGVASIPVSLFSNTNTPSNIIYSLWFYIDVGKGGQSRILKGTIGGTPATVDPSGPGIVWEAVGGGVYRLIETTSSITDGVSANTHSDGTDARFYYDAGSSLAQGSWHHVIVQHSWDGANSRWISNVFINGARATTADGTSVSDVHIDSGNTSQSILDTNGNNYLVCTRATTIDSYNVVIDSSDTITEAMAASIYSDSTRQTGILEAIALNP